MASKQHQLFEAIHNNDLPKVKELVCDPSVDLKWKEGDHTPIFLKACLCRRVEIMRYLMKECPRTSEIDFDGEDGSMNPFHFACMNDYYDEVALMVDDKRIDVNRPGKSNWTPLFGAAVNRCIKTVIALLASTRDIDTTVRATQCFNGWTEGKTAAEVARYRHCSEIAYLIESYAQNPNRVRDQMRRTLAKTAGLFALVVLYSDNYLVPTSCCWTAKAYETRSNATRFFKICSQLPLELQMTVCNRAFGSAKDIILHKDYSPFLEKFCSAKNLQ